MATKKPQRLNHEPDAVIFAREKAGLSRSELARRVGVSLSLISMIESGHRSATPKLLPELAAAVNCPVVFLERKRYQAPAPVAATAEAAA
jgi:transcriptional regulator with XRE-family HTH domain